MKDMKGLSLVEFRDKRLDELLSKTLPDDWEDIEIDNLNSLKANPCVFSLPEAYLLLHTDLDKFLEMKALRNAKAKNVQKDHIENVLRYICTYYDAVFRYETEKFIEDTIDDLYKRIDKWENELKGIPFYQDQIKQLEGIPLYQKKISENIKGISENLRALKEMMGRFVIDNVDWLKDTSYGEIQPDQNAPQDKKAIIKITFRPSDVTKLKKYVGSKSWKDFFLDNKRYNKFNSDCTEMNKIYAKISDGMQKIYRSPFKAGGGKLHLEVQNYRDYEITYNLLTSLEYGLSSCYHAEVILLFLYDQYKEKYFPETLKMVIQKNEDFYDALYRSMCDANDAVRVFFEMPVGYEKIAKSQGYQLRAVPKHRTIQTYKNSLVEFKRLLLMYKIVFPDHNLCDCAAECFRYWDTILPQTRLLNFFYDDRLSILSDFLMKTGLNQKALAKILGISESAVSIAASKGSLFRNPKHSWFWMAITGLMYDYFTGAVTTDVYGRDPIDNHNRHYQLWPTAMISDGGKMLKVISELASFKQGLSRNDSPYKKYEHPFYKASIRKSTALVCEIADVLYDIQVELKRKILAKNQEEIERLSKKDAINPEQEKSIILDISENPQYRSFLQCLEINRDLLKLVLENSKEDHPNYLFKIEDLVKGALNKPLSTETKQERIQNLLNDIAKVVMDEWNKKPSGASKKKPPNAAPK